MPGIETLQVVWNGAAGDEHLESCR